GDSLQDSFTDVTGGKPREARGVGHPRSHGIAAELLRAVGGEVTYIAGYGRLRSRVPVASGADDVPGDRGGDHHGCTFTRTGLGPRLRHRAHAPDADAQGL